MFSPQTIFELQKMVLKQVSEDKNLFQRELKKSFLWLQSSEIFQLHWWADENNESLYNAKISEVFNRKAIV